MSHGSAAGLCQSRSDHIDREGPSFSREYDLLHYCCLQGMWQERDSLRSRGIEANNTGHYAERCIIGLRGKNNHGSDRHDRTLDRRCGTTFSRRATRNHDPANTLIPSGAVPADSDAIGEPYLAAGSPLEGRSPPVTLQAGDNLSDLGRIDNDGDHRHSGSASGAGHDVHLMNLGQQPRPGLPARSRADLLVLRGIGAHSWPKVDENDVLRMPGEGLEKKPLELNVSGFS